MRKWKKIKQNQLYRNNMTKEKKNETKTERNVNCDETDGRIAKAE